VSMLLFSQCCVDYNPLVPVWGFWITVVEVSPDFCTISVFSSLQLLNSSWEALEEMQMPPQNFSIDLASCNDLYLV
jgi:hypothetical protein